MLFDGRLRNAKSHSNVLIFSMIFRPAFLDHSDTQASRFLKTRPSCCVSKKARRFSHCPWLDSLLSSPTSAALRFALGATAVQVQASPPAALYAFRSRRNSWEGPQPANDSSEGRAYFFFLPFRGKERGSSRVTGRELRCTVAPPPLSFWYRLVDSSYRATIHPLSFFPMMLL
jgi:hypothetical protein